MGQAVRVVKVPAIVPAMTGEKIISNSDTSRRGSRRMGVINRLIFLDFDMTVSLWLMNQGSRVNFVKHHYFCEFSQSRLVFSGYLPC